MNSSSSDVSKQPTEYREFRALTIVTLLSIATIIGSGILALPVTLFETSVPPFIFLFTLSGIGQIAVIHVAVELLQRARVAKNVSQAQTSYNSIETPSEASHEPPNISLFTLAELYLPNSLTRYAFYISTQIGFIALIVSYGLAGPQALWQLLKPNTLYTTTPTSVVFIYWAIGSACVVFLLDHLLGLFGLFTVLKCTLFSGVVLIVAFLPPAAHISSLSNLLSDFSEWKHSGIPFLVSCVAVGGLPNTMPVTFKLLPSNATATHIRNFRTAVILAIVVCYLLNIGWVLAVLQIVPREAANNAPSLTRAFNLGHISTVPLIDVLNDGGDVQGPLLSTVKVAVGMFIFISTGVSFFVMSAGMKNFIDGGLHYMDETYGGGEKEVWFRKSVAYMGSFGAILWISVDDPSGFINILANTSSFALSFQAGLLLFLMLYNCRRSIGAGAGVGGIEGGEEENGSNVEKKERRLDTCDGCIPLEMSRSLSTVYIVYGVLFFLLACCMAAIAPFVGLTSQVEE